MNRVRHLLMAVLSASLIYSGQASADFEKGFKHYQSGDYTAAFSEFKKAAENGDTRAYGKLGALYLYGRGTDKDPFNAYIWFGMAAQTGDKYASRYRDAASSMMSSAQVYQAEKSITELQDRSNTP